MIIDPKLLQPNPIPESEKLAFTLPYELLNNGNSYKLDNNTIALIYENKQLVRTINMGIIHQSDIQPNQKIVVFKFDKYLKLLTWKMPKAPFIDTELKIKITGRVLYKIIDPIKVFNYYSTETTHEKVQHHISAQILNITTQVVMKCKKDDPIAILFKYAEIKAKISKELDKIGIMIEFDNFSLENYN